MTQATFHWLRAETFVYATEREDLVRQTFMDLVGTDEIDEQVSESEHGNRLIILQARLTKQRELDALFLNLGKDLLAQYLEDLENRIDDDCIFYTRLDKQKAVRGEYAVAHHGDVISLTGKVASNPRKKEVAVRIMSDYLRKLIGSPAQERHCPRPPAER